MPSTKPHPCACPRMYFVLSFCLFFLGGGLFVAAWSNSIVHTVSHPFRGFEWVGPLCTSTALLFMLRMPREKDAAAWTTFDQDGKDRVNDLITRRLVAVVVFTCAGFLLTALTCVYEWWAPGPHTISAHDAQVSRGIFSSPSPSPSPRPTTIKIPTEPDFMTGNLLFGSQFALFMCIVSTWFLVTGPTISELARGQVDNMMDDAL